MKYNCTKDTYLHNTLIAKKGDKIDIVNATLTNLSNKSKKFDNWEVINNMIASGILEPVKEDKVNHPSHYTWLKEKCGIEVIDIARHLDFSIGNAVKYLLRAGHKSEEGMTDKDKTVQDLKKAIWYINDKIRQLENN